jgi:hypothetical protein
LENSEKNVILIVNGDSNTYGEELVPDEYKSKLSLQYAGTPGCILTPCETNSERKLFDEYRSKHCWGYKLGELIGANQVINLGWPGGSNDRIVRTTLEYIDSNHQNIKNNPDNYIFIIGWTAPDRTEFYVEQYKNYKNFHPTSTNEEVEYYFTRLSTDHGSRQRSYQHIVTLQNTFKKLGLKYIFFAAYPSYNIFDFNIFKPSTYSNLIDTSLIIQETMHGYLGNSYAKGPRYHYFEEGHAVWAKYIEKFL